MQTEKNKQLPILIALSAILVLAVGYAVKKSLPAPKPAQEAATAQAQDPEQEQPKAFAEPKGPDGAPLPDTYQFVGNPPKDPFQAKLAGASSTNPSGVIVGNRANRPGGTGARRIAQNISLPPLSLPGLGQGLRLEQGSGGTDASAPETPPFIATGVVSGSYDIAILRGDAGGRYFVREGQSVGDGYTVNSISSSGVVLKNKNRRVFLKLGGSQDARSTDRPRQAGQ